MVDYLSQLHKLLESMEKVFRSNVGLAKAIALKIKDLLNKANERYGGTEIKIMNFCGTHEWTVTHYGIRSLIPQGIRLIAGPGCPVCVTPSYYIEEAIKLAFDGVTIYTYGDTYRLRTVRLVRGVRSLSEARAYGCVVKIVSSLTEAISDAKTHGKDSMFIGIGFETVVSGYARALLNNAMPSNLKLLSIVKLTPPAMRYTLEVHKNELPVRGVIAPGHVSTIIGAKAWSDIAQEFKIPIVVSGFEPIDVLLSILEILRQLSIGKAETVIEYKRAVTWDGDKVAQKMISEAFDIVDDAWRGIGFIPRSGLRLKNVYRIHDAFAEYGIKELTIDNWAHDISPGCRCADIILGKAIPVQCPLFMKVCTPLTPIGPCMVSVEGACAIWARHGGATVVDVAKELGLQDFAQLG